MGACSPVPRDNFARVFSDTGAELFKMQHGHWVCSRTPEPNSVCALPDGRLLTGSRDNFARVFSDTGAELFKMQHGDLVLDPSAPFRMGACSPVPVTTLRACSRTPEPNFSRCSTATRCIPSVPFRMGACSPVPLTTLRACSRTPEPNFSRCSTATM